MGAQQTETRRLGKGFSVSILLPFAEFRMRWPG